jgi:hypothetical protein
VWLFFAPVIVLAIAFAIVPPENPMARYIEPLLYAACAVLGLGVGALSLRERVSLFIPSHTLDESPVMFWVDVVGGCFLFGAIGIWKTARVLQIAL